MSKYTIEDINVGDEIYYEDRYRSNKHSRWKVVQKLDKTMLLIVPSKGNSVETRIIDVLDVRSLEIIPKK